MSFEVYQWLVVAATAIGGAAGTMTFVRLGHRASYDDAPYANSSAWIMGVVSGIMLLAILPGAAAGVFNKDDALVILAPIAVIGLTFWYCLKWARPETEESTATRR